MIFYGPEINSDSANFVATPPLSILACSPLPDQSAVTAHDDYTGSFQNIQCYDSLKVQAILNQIDGKTHDGSSNAPVPAIFGMNFPGGERRPEAGLSARGSLPAPYSVARWLPRCDRDPEPFTVAGNPVRRYFDRADD